MISNKDLRVEGGNLIINGEKHPLDPAVIALTKRANIVQGKLSALDTKLVAIEALEKTASGNPISITGAAAAYAMSNIMSIEPIQSGSGDPSPTNVRPISGISTATVQANNGEDTNTASITFGQTVYGGSVNFKTGEVTITHGMVDAGTLGWFNNTAGSNDVFVASMPSNSTESSSNVGLDTGICSNYKSVAMSPPSLTDKCFTLGSKWYGGHNIVVRDTDYTDAAAFKTAMSGVQLCYELATPTTLTLTPAELELLKGANTISGNGANINISYIGR